MMFLAASLVILSVGLLLRGFYLTFIKKEIDFERLYPGYVISKRHLSVIERDMENLSEVVIIANKAEKPDFLLLDAVRDNLLEGVNYYFYVSETNAAYATTVVEPFFEGVIKLLRMSDLSEGKTIGKVHFETTGFEWAGLYPFAFYLYHKPGQKPTHGHRHVLGFRGTVLDVGVADQYMMIQGEVSKTIINQMKNFTAVNKIKLDWVNSLENLEFKSEIEEDLVKYRGNDNVIKLANER